MYEEAVTLYCEIISELHKETKEPINIEWVRFIKSLPKMISCVYQHMLSLCVLEGDNNKDKDDWKSLALIKDMCLCDESNNVENAINVLLELCVNSVTCKIAQEMLFSFPQKPVLVSAADAFVDAKLNYIAELKATQTVEDCVILFILAFCIVDNLKIQKVLNIYYKCSPTGKESINKLLKIYYSSVTFESSNLDYIVAAENATNELSAHILFSLRERLPDCLKVFVIEQLKKNRSEILSQYMMCCLPYDALMGYNLCNFLNIANSETYITCVLEIHTRSKTDSWAPINLSHLLYYLMVKVPDQCNKDIAFAHKKCLSGIIKKLEQSDYQEFIQLLMEASALPKVPMLLMVVVLEASAKHADIRGSLASKHITRCG